MRSKNTLLIVVAAAIVLAAVPATSFAEQKNRAARDFHHADKDGDNKLSPAEWNRRGNFDRLDANGDGVLTLTEVEALYKGHGDKNYPWPPKDFLQHEVGIDTSVQNDRVARDALDQETICGIARLKRCDIDDQIKRGLFATGTGPHFPEKATCPGIDDYWAMDYSSKRRRTSFHGGIDIPAPWGTPIHAVAAGSVVATYRAEQSKRGNEVVLRHSPEQTGLPIWTYSAYGHLDALPDLQIGQKIAMGEIIGPTGNSGISAMGEKGSDQSKTRRPAIHLALFYSSTGKYSESNETIVPLDGYWLDPMAFYRQQEPFDSVSIKALPESEKDVLIPVLLQDGTTIPATTKIIWPYTCQGE